MTIKEVEQELGIPRATIRFYEKQKLIHPVRGDNSYRIYSEEDVSVLKKIIIFRKIGMSLSDIENLLGGIVTLPVLVDKNITQLQQQINELNGAIKVCRQIQSRQEQMENFDEQFYWDEICREEKAGNRFLDIARDAVHYEKKMIFEYFNIADNEGNLLYGKKESVFRALGVCVFIGSFNFFLCERQVSDFFEGFLLPISWIVVYTGFGLPLYFLGKKYPKTAKIIRRIGRGVVVTLIVLLLLIVVLSK